MINDFMPYAPDTYYWRSTLDCSNTAKDRFWDYGYSDWDDHLEDRSLWKIDANYGPFHVYEVDNVLIVELIHNNKRYRKSLAREIESLHETMGYAEIEREIFEPIWANGLDFINLEEIGAMSEAPAFMSVSYLPDWLEGVKQLAHDYPYYLLPDYAAIDWKHTRVWSAINYYQIKSPLDYLVESGRCEFHLAQD